MKTADEARANGYEVTTITNRSKKPLEVMLEVWGLGTTLQPQASCEVWLKHDDPNDRVVEYAEGFIIFYASSAAIWQNGEMTLDLL